MRIKVKKLLDDNVNILVNRDTRDRINEIKYKYKKKYKWEIMDEIINVALDALEKENKDV